MLNEVVRQAIQQNPEYGVIASVVEKEILHHDIQEEMKSKVADALRRGPEAPFSMS